MVRWDDRDRDPETDYEQRPALDSTGEGKPFDLPDFFFSDKDVTVHLDLDLQIDLQEDIEALAHLNSLGRFKDGIRLFEERLREHLDFFPVVAEYADLLLEQGSYGVLSDFLSGCLTEQQDSSVAQFTDDEILLLRILRACGDIYCKGALRPALVEAITVFEYFEDQGNGADTWLENATGVQVHMIEIYIFELSPLHDRPLLFFRTLPSKFWRSWKSSTTG
ncbi:hypothetical protein VTN77DRAFT_4302 [Rasamsonia byssochlamydoides]|uniref:uncharacterized protein n=1 Tax=Rasamsonia byssochlamydoides TaxID=89139 RepID=UPI0037430BC8